MIASRTNLLVVGSFVLAMAVSLVVALAVLSGRSGETDEYYTVFPNVAGLKYGAQVLYEGYPIGQIEELTPQPEAGRMNFKVRLSVIADWRIPSDSLAQISVSGLLAPATIAIQAGSSQQHLEPGQMITPGGSAGLFAAFGGIGEQFTEINRDLRPLINNVDAQVTSFGALMSGDGAQALANLNSLTAQLDAVAPKLLADLSVFSGNLAETGELLQSTQSAARSLDQAARRVDALVAQSGDDITATTRDLRHAAAVVAGRIDTLAYHLEAASRDMAEFSHQIRTDPSRVLRRTKPGETPEP